MTFKAQLDKLKDNWLLAALIVLLILFSSFSTNFSGITANYAASRDTSYAPEYTSKMAGTSFYQGESFAPDVQERITIKTVHMSSEVEHDAFDAAHDKLKSAISSSGSILLNENVQQYDTKRRAYRTGYYTLKVDTKKYDSVVKQLKEIGEVKSFSENTQDVTGRYTNLKIELASEKERLARYEEMYKSASEISDKIELNDRIFNQERTIKYIEESLQNIDTKVDYSEISVTLTEKRSAYADIALVKLSELLNGLVASFNSLLSWLFYLVPWTAAFLAGRFLYRKLK